MRGDLAGKPEKERKTCMKHFIKVDEDGICRLCRPNLDMHVDKSYVNSRDALIPEALRLARQRVALLKNKIEVRNGKEGTFYNHSFLAEFFSEEMTKAVKQAGIRG